ncbi:MAG: 50S ribosomal protein L23 [Armatimonadetes bacterium]|nr:50S ribosomal protein L23 [Armatimonadota bacterium]
MDEVRDPHTIIIKPHITEKSAALSYGDPMIMDESELRRSYTFVVEGRANKIEIKQAIESIYNAGKRDKDSRIMVVGVRTIKVRGKMRRVGQSSRGKRPGFKKAIVTLAKGQILEDYGV